LRRRCLLFMTYLYREVYRAKDLAIQVGHE